MLKNLVVILALLASVGPYKGRAQDQHTGQAKASPTLAAPKSQNPQQKQNVPRQESLEPHAGIEWSNWALVTVGAITFAAVLKQAVESAKATKAMRDSIRLQEIQYKQWVEVGGWKNLTHYVQPNASEATLTLGFEVGNTTKFPLTLKRLTTKKGAESSSVSMEYLIAPEDSYVAFHSFDVSPADLELYRHNKLAVTLSIDAEIKDVLERECAPQRFTQTISFGPTRCDAMGHPPHLQVKIKQTR